MTNFRIEYSHPWLLLLIIPALLFTLVPHLRIAKKYRRTRNRIISVVLHAVAMVVAINLLAGINFRYEVPNLDNEVILLVDVSDSNEEDRELKDEFVGTVINVADNQYKVGVVKFGYGQKYVAELSANTEQVYMQYLESEDPDSTATDLASALEYARTLFTNPQTGKIVVLSDGVETDGNATSVIKSIAADGIKVDTVHFPNEEKDELQIVSVDIPDQHFVVGEAFLIDMTLRSNLGNTEQPISIRFIDNGEEVGVASVTLTKEEQTLPVEIVLNERGMHELSFEIASTNDTLTQNNRYHTYINLQEFDNLLLIERYAGESEKLQELLAEKYNLTALSIENDTDKMPRDINAMAEYEQIVLVNIAYSDMPAGFEALLNQYVYDLGGGLFTVGGTNDIVNGKVVPHAYNREDMEKSTYYKQMLPVNAIDYTPPIAVMIVVDASASMSMGKLEAAIEGAEACLDALNDRDFCGVMSFQSRASEELAVLPVSQREQILESIKKIGDDDDAGSGGTIFSDAIIRAGRALSVIENVERKHIIMVTDGDPGDSYEDYLPYIEENMKDEITMSVVTIDISSHLKEKMEQTATAGGGKFYNIKYSEMQTIPSIMQQDLVLEAIAEIEYGEEFLLSIKDKTTVVAGITEESIPPLTGYYGTVKKEDALVPLMGKYVPIYAQWKYGKGNVGSFMSDLNGEWSNIFIDDLVGKTIITNIVDSIFPTQDVRADGLNYIIKKDNYTTQLNVHGVDEDHRIEVEVIPVSESLAHLLDKGISVTAAESNRRFIFEIKDAGLYEIRIKNFDAESELVSEIVLYETFSYSEEYNMFTERAPIGEELLSIIADDGNGIVVADAAEIFLTFSKTVKKEFDPRVILLILAIVAYLLDIAVRKFKFKWPHEIIREYKQKKADSAKKSA